MHVKILEVLIPLFYQCPFELSVPIKKIAVLYIHDIGDLIASTPIRDVSISSNRPLKLERFKRSALKCCKMNI